ncbi:MAG TPA: hypothetical protein VM658_16025 [bacterium]|nr:hypothetical protein [bacterium]
MGTLFTMLGAYFTAFLAKHSELKHGLAMGTVSLVLGALMLLVMKETGALWYNLISLDAVLPAAALGAYLRIWTKGLDAPPPGPGPQYYPPPLYKR